MLKRTVFGLPEGETPEMALAELFLEIKRPSSKEMAFKLDTAINNISKYYTLVTGCALSRDFLEISVRIDDYSEVDGAFERLLVFVEECGFGEVLRACECSLILHVRSDDPTCDFRVSGECLAGLAKYGLGVRFEYLSY